MWRSECQPEERGNLGRYFISKCSPQILRQQNWDSDSREPGTRIIHLGDGGSPGDITLCNLPRELSYFDSLVA